MGDQSNERWAPRGPAIPGEHPLPLHPDCEIIPDIRPLMRRKIEEWLAQLAAEKAARERPN
ncbi:hypothetical protein HY624_01370 [Candidatus Uhrbacteria bacterium]|nr:hypothetical protein [Candidatus Uhrbacteria bacterium]